MTAAVGGRLAIYAVSLLTGNPGSHSQVTATLGMAPKSTSQPQSQTGERQMDTGADSENMSPRGQHSGRPELAHRRLSVGPAPPPLQRDHRSSRGRHVEAQFKAHVVRHKEFECLLSSEFRKRESTRSEGVAQPEAQHSVTVSTAQ